METAFIKHLKLKYTDMDIDSVLNLIESEFKAIELFDPFSVANPDNIISLKSDLGKAVIVGMLSKFIDNRPVKVFKDGFDTLKLENAKHIVSAFDIFEKEEDKSIAAYFWQQMKRRISKSEFFNSVLEAQAYIDGYQDHI